MTTFAMMNGNTVENIIITDNKEECEKTLQCVLILFDESNPAVIGGTYDPVTNLFFSPVQTFNNSD